MKIFCAETLWNTDISSSRTSYDALMKLVQTESGCDFSFFTFNTPEELDHLLTIFKESRYDVFYIASHMKDGNITSGYKKQFTISVEDIVKRNKEALKNRILHLGGCSSLSEDVFNPKKIKRLSSLKAVSGYRIDTDSTESTAMDLLYLTTLAREGLNGLGDKLSSRYNSLVEASGFKIYVMKEI